MPRKTVVALLVACVALAAAAPAHAQERTLSPRLSAGAFWSANFATLSLGSSSDRATGRQSVGGGFSVEWSLANGWSFDGRALWNRRGARLPLPGTSADYREVTADYVSLPMLIKSSHGAAGSGAVRAYAVGGAEVGLRTASRVRTMRAGAVTRSPGHAARVDVALDAGAGLERALPSARLFVEALYAHGLRSVTGTGTGERARTRTLTLLAGLRF